MYQTYRGAHIADQAGVHDRGGSRHARRDPEDELLHVLYQEHAEAVLRFVVRITGGDRQRAEDIVQETLLRAWCNADKLDPHAAVSLRPWLFTVARRIAIDEYRSASVRPPETYDRDVETLSLDDETDRVNASLVVADAMRSLSPAHREILIETYLRDRTVNEVAELLGLPIGTAKSRVYYALRALRVALDDRSGTGETPY